MVPCATTGASESASDHVSKPDGMSNVAITEVARRLSHRKGYFGRLRSKECRIPGAGTKILSALREKPLKVFDVMKRANISNQEACQSLLLKIRDQGSVKFDIHKGQWLIA